ncbi:flagellar hook-length control protein FliK [Thermoproteota archaeon]
MTGGIQSGASQAGRSIRTGTPWPKTGTTEPVSGASSVAESPRITKGVGAPSKASDIKTPLPTPKETGKAGAKKEAVTPRPIIARPISPEDIRDQLLQIQQPPTKENQQIISMLLQYGLEASSGNFEAVSALLKGRKKATSIESAVVTVGKGLEGTPKSVDILESFFAKNLQLAVQLQQLQQGFSGLNGLLQSHKELFSQGLFSGLCSLCTDFEDLLKKIGKKFTNEDMSIQQINRKELIVDFKAFYEFLIGIDKSLLEQSGQPGAAKLIAQLETLKQDIQSFLANLTSQAILSKDDAAQFINGDKYAYFQLPNPLANVPFPMDLLIKKSVNGEVALDPEKTRIVMRLQTPDLGELGIVIDIQEKRLWYTFHTDSSHTKDAINELITELRDSMEALSYDIVGIQTLPKKINVKKAMLPKLNLDDLSRVSTEI